MKEWLQQAVLPPGGGEPLYKKLANLLLAAIDKGELPPEGRLPTVRDLADKMKLSQGTVKHAYDELGLLGVIEKVQGRGTFIRARETETAVGKKDRAMRAIDNLLEKMKELGFSLNETQVFWNLKLREREEIPRFVRVAVVDCNPEALYIIANQITCLHNVEVRRFLLDDVLHNAHLLGRDMDLIVTTANHFDQLKEAVGQVHQVRRVVLSPTSQTIAKLAKLGAKQRVGLFVASERFAQIIRASLQELAATVYETGTPCFLFGTEGDAADFLEDLDTAILPDQYAHFCSPNDLAAVRAFQGAGGAVIDFTYQIDAGSLMYLEQQIAHVLEEKGI